jgi:hypothetical protein
MFLPDFTNSKGDFRSDVIKSLPPSLESFDLEKSMASPADLVSSVFSIFVILKLISVGHPQSKPYYDEICQTMYQTEELHHCEKVIARHCKMGL